MWTGTSSALADAVSARPWISITLSCLLCLVCSLGLRGARLERDIRKSFSPEDSDSGREARVYLDFFDLEEFPQRAFILFFAKDGGTMLREEHLSEVQRLDSMLMSSLETIDPVDGLRACEPQCAANRHFNLFKSELLSEWSGNTSSSRLLDYPTATLRGHDIFMGMNMFGVKRSEVMHAGNHSHIEHVKSIILWYFSRFDTQQRKESLRETTLALFEMSKAHNFSHLIDFNIFGDEIANHEMVRGAFEATIMMCFGFLLLLAYVTGVVAKQSPFCSTPYLVSSTLLTPLLSTVAAMGLLSWLGYPLYSIECITPFLALGIGVDDAFILMHRWNHYTGIADKHARLRNVIVDVGPSITITSLTNIIAFGVGFLTPTPQMSLFCLCTSLALLLDYVFTYTILGPVLYLYGGTVYSSVSETEKVPLDELERQAEKEGVCLRYARFLCSGRGRILATTVFVGLVVFSSIGVVSMRATFEPKKAFPSDSPLSNSLQGIRPVFNEFFPMNIFVMNPPNISNPDEMSSFDAMLTQLESLPFVYGRERTVLFLKQYEQFDREITDTLRSFLFAPPAEDYHLSLHNLGFWLDRIGNPPMVKYARPNDTTSEGRLEAFQFTLIASSMAEWATRAEFVAGVRAVLKAHPQFNASLFDGDSAILTLIQTVSRDLLGSILITVLCMAAVCLFFIESKRGVVIITVTITSICYNLVGLLSWLGADLDPVTQVDVLLATGFSVDYTAHIAYHFYSSPGSTVERVQRCLQEMAAPMIQAGVSTCLCMLPLVLVQTYAILAFAKTVFLVVGIGLLHGLFLLPVLLVLLNQNRGQPVVTEYQEDKLEPLVQVPRSDVGQA